MKTFRCKRSGNTVSFTNENDIAGLRKHEGYEEVIYENSEKRTDDANDAEKGNDVTSGQNRYEEDASKDASKDEPTRQVLKLRGRPRKVG